VIPVSLILYGGLALAGAGASWYVMDLRSDKAALTEERDVLLEGVRLTNKAIKLQEQQVAAILEQGRADLADAVRAAELNLGLIDDLLTSKEPTTCEASVEAAQAAFRRRK
jgi:hypothetical protein